PLCLLGRPKSVQGKELSDVLTAVDHGSIDGQAIQWIEVDDSSRMVILNLADGSQVGAHYPDYYGGTLVGRLESTGIPFETDAPASPSIWPSLLMTFLPVALIIGFLVWFARRSGMGGARAFTTAKAEVGDVPVTRFNEVVAARVRNLFAKAKKTGGIIFLDELDSIGRARTGTTPGSGGTDERESTLNALLVEMDGFGKDGNVIIIAATNRPDVLDSALLRAGRFDRQVMVAPPARKGRTRLLELYTADRKTAPDVDFVALARRMPGLTGADIAN